MKGRTEPTVASQSKRYLIILAIPIVFIIGCVEYIAALSGESYSPQALSEMQKADPRLVILTKQPYYTFKLARYAQEKPEVVYIGTSRSVHVRSEMFKPYNFYNASLSAWNFTQLTQFLKLMLEVHHPQMIVFSLDYFMFSHDWVRGNRKYDDFTYHPGIKSHFQAIGSVLDLCKTSPKKIRALLPTLIAGEKPIEETDHMRLFGMHGIHNEAGMRYDGSFLFSKGQLQSAPKLTVTETLIQAMPGAAQMDPKEIEAMKEFAKLARDNGITLVGIAMPLFKGSIDYMDTNKDYWKQAGVWREFNSPESQQLFAENGIHFFNMARLKGNDDIRNFMDGYHPNERGVLATFVELSANPEFRSLFSKLEFDRIKKDYANALENDQLFEIYHDKF